MPTDPPAAAALYHAFLLRLWRDDARGPWRASVTPIGGEPVRFADPAAAWAYVQAQLETNADAASSGERNLVP